jgi:F-type H+-transporting ATPase subunit epsilon
MPMHLEIITAERVVLSDEVDQINVPTKDGRIGILPRHMPLLTILDAGEMTIIKNGESTPFAVTGGFMEVLPTRVTILADSVDRADEIDEARAEEARKRAEQLLLDQQSEKDIKIAEAELRRALVQLKVAGLQKLKKQR